MKVIRSLQVFRGLAALAVVVHHAEVSTNAFVGAGPAGVDVVLGMGYLGVDFFFVLSGFIIMHAHMDDQPSLVSVRRYLFKRLVRIFPPYLPISVGLLALYAMLPELSAAGGRDYSMFSSLFLLPADLPPALSVAWTLIHEMQFYIIFLLFFVSRRLFVAGIVVWAGLILVMHSMEQPTGWLRYPFSLLNLDFMFGVLAAWFVSDRCQLKVGSLTWLFAGGGWRWSRFSP